MKIRALVFRAFVALSAITPLTGRASEKEVPHLTGMMGFEKRFVIFVAMDDGPIRQLSAIGASIGPFALVGVDCTKGFADFKQENEKVVRVWLPESSVKPGGAPLTIALPPLNTIKGLVGMDEAIAMSPRAAVEKIVMDLLNRRINGPTLSWEERTQLLADFISGKTKITLVPPKGIDEAFAKKYGLTPEEVYDANSMNHVGPGAFTKK